MSGREAYVKISASREVDTSSLLDQSAVFSYPATVVHEYGHMLGLQDEYSCLSDKASAAMTELNFIDVTEQDKYEKLEFNLLQGRKAKVTSPVIAAGQAAIIGLCHDAGVDIPQFSFVLSLKRQARPVHILTGLPWFSIWEQQRLFSTKSVCTDMRARLDLKTDAEFKELLTEPVNIGAWFGEIEVTCLAKNHLQLVFLPHLASESLRFRCLRYLYALPNKRPRHW